MKKLLSILLAVLLCLALVACDSGDVDWDDEETTNEVVTTEEIRETEVATEATTQTMAEAQVKPANELLIRLLQNELYGLGVNNSAYVPEIKVYADGTFTFYCNLYYGMITYSGKWEKQTADNADTYFFTVDAWIPLDEEPVAVTSADLPVNLFTLTQKHGQRIAQFNINSSAYFGMTYNNAYFDIVGGDVFATVEQKKTNGEVMGTFVSKFNQNDGTMYSFADVTHDGYVEMFATKQDGYACEFQVYTLDGNTPKLIYEGFSDNTTNGLRYYHLYSENLDEYILCAGFYYRQGSPLFYYYIFSLDEDGNEIMYAKNEYDAGKAVLENEEEILSEIRNEFNVYTSNLNGSIIGEQNGDVYPGAWEYSRFMKYTEIFDGQGISIKCSGLRVGKYSYTVEDGKATLVDYNYVGLTDETEAVVPREIDGYPVVAIERGVFEGHYRLKSIEIHENVLSIAEKAFDGCSSLEYIKCAASTAAEEYANAHGIAVKYIERLSSSDDEVTKETVEIAPTPVVWDDVTFENEYTSGDYRVGVADGKIMILDYYGSDSDIVVPDTIDGYPVLALGKEAFYYHKFITTVTLPEGLEYIGESAFANCYNVGSLNIPNSVTHIGQMAFYCCESLKSVVIPSSVKVVGSHAFKLCYGVESLVISNGVEVIGDNAFANMNKLTSVEIPESVKSIGEYAFATSGYSEIHIPKNVSEIGIMVFFECSKLEKITVDAENKHFTTDENGVLYNKDMTKLVAFPNQLVSYTVPESVTEIPEYFFIQATALEKVELHAGITHIGSYAFRSCGALVEVTIHGNPTVGDFIFSGCEKLAVVKCAAGTYVESQAKAKGFNVEYIG